MFHQNKIPDKVYRWVAGVEGLHPKRGNCWQPSVLNVKKRRKNRPKGGA